MQRPERPIIGFRRRLQRLIDERCDGKYTRLARRAGIPVSSLQHVVHHSRHLPGGEHLGQLAEALGVSVDYLTTGRDAIRPAELQALRVVLAGDQIPPLGNTTHLALPVFWCGCPAACPLTEPVPSVAAAQSEVVFPATMLTRYGHHHLLAVQIGQGLHSPEWPEGAQLVLDWDARIPRWEAISLLHTEARCRLGHAAQSGEQWMFAARVAAPPELLANNTVMLGTVIALMMPA